MVFNQPKKIPSLETGMAKPFAAPTPQKTIQPVNPATGVAQPAPVNPAPAGNLQTWDQLASKQFDLGQFGNASTGFNNQGLTNSFTNLAKTIGYNGAPLQSTTFNSTYEGESGPVNQQMSGSAVNPELLTALGNYRYSTEDTGDGRVKLGVYGQDGSQVGSYLHGTKDSGFDKFAEKAIPIGLGALGAAAFGGLIPGAEIGAAGATGGSAATAGAAGAADIGALGLTESVYGAGGALGAGAAPGTVGGLAGSTAGFGGLGSVLPAGVGFGEAAALGAGALDLATVGGADPAGMVPGGSPTPELDALMGGTDLEASLAGNTFGAESGIGAAGQGGGITGAIAQALADPGNALKAAGSSVVDFAKANPQLAALGVSGLAQLAGGSPSLPAAPGSGGSGSGGTNALATALENQIGGMGAPDYSGVFALKNSPGDLNTLNQEAIDAAYSQQTRFLDPQFQRDQQAMEARLAEQGFVPGTPGYDRAMSIFNEARNQAYGSARDSSILQGYQIGQGDARNAISATELNNSASRESLAQILAKRNQPFNELASIKGNQQIDYNNALDRYNAEAASSNSRNQALSQLALALGMYLG